MAAKTVVKFGGLEKSTHAVWTELPHMGTLKRGGAVLPAFVDWKAWVKSWVKTYVAP